MQTGFEIMDYDKNLKNLWIHRFIAGLIDFAITYTVAFFITYFLWHGMSMLDLLIISFFLQGPVWYFYSLLFDIVWGKTPGKIPMRIRSVSFVGELTPKQILIRNLTKLNVILAIADAIAGLSTEGDPRQRYTERFIDSLTITEISKRRRVKEFEAVESKGEKEREEELVLPE